ncbi:uncharacterized protein si:dkey-83m22.7 isoform X2 [Anguilla anguilla]|uniref:uncharacterized protein si:dkey-83m22.7 isoform X2 n=1 Tax=Anguilla anguilla TaxID=7936 RepID=UPI0015AC0A5E|nr:uncharacterized protein si:dkey-83m22.7 isoform X2 [Anguilla anguilla]
MQHRAYQPILPCGNKYLQQKWDRTHYEMHQKKVTSAKPTVSTGPPQTYGHLQLKLKKLKLEEERMSIIQRDNKMLLDKISFIMRTTGHIDNRNNYENRSLCREKRQQELLRVSKENQVIVERLSRCGPRYSRRQWHEDWLRTEEYRESIARYPRSASLIKARPKSIKQAAKEAKGDKSVQERSGGDNAPGDKNNKSGEKAETDERKGSDGERDAETKNSESDSDSDKHD